MKRILKIIFLSFSALILIMVSLFFIWALTPSLPQSKALSNLETNTTVQVDFHQKYISFTPTGNTPSTAFLFYPGGHVDYRAYSPILRQIAQQGFLVILLQVNLNLAFFDIDAGAGALRDYPAIKNWVIGGHSLGGVAAGLYALKEPKINGIVFWASYPANDGLKETQLKVLSVYGSQDGTLNNGYKIENKKDLLPTDAKIIMIPGGNHAQFGDYGLQPGDNPATISAEEQWRQVAEQTVQFLQEISINK